MTGAEEPNLLTVATDRYSVQLRARGERALADWERPDRTIVANVTVHVTSGERRIRCNWCGVRAIGSVHEFINGHRCASSGIKRDAR
jgi:hypothetical protein